VTLLPLAALTPVPSHRPVHLWDIPLTAQLRLLQSLSSIYAEALALIQLDPVKATAKPNRNSTVPVLMMLTIEIVGQAGVRKCMRGMEAHVVRIFHHV
jgi:hypothetical protein